MTILPALKTKVYWNCFAITHTIPYEYEII